MKKRAISLLMAASLVGGCFALTGCGAKTEKKGTLTVFNYAEYIDPDVLDEFYDETGIEVKYEEALTPEELYTKYKSGAIDYDLVCTSDYMLQKLINEGELQKINLDNLEYKDNVGQKYWDFAKAFDPQNEYTVPYFWGTVGILYDTTKVKEPVDSWDVLFNHEYAGEIIMQNSMRDSYMLALKYLGYSLNSEDDKELQEAQDLLLAQKPDVQAYLVDEARDEVVAGNATMAVVYSGEAYLGNQYNSDLEFVIPKEGTNIWLDAWGITKNCKNVEYAEQFLDFLCREDIATQNFEYIYYSTVNDAVIEGLSEEDRNNEALVPSDEKTKNCEVSQMLSPEATEKMNEMWKELKAD